MKFHGVNILVDPELRQGIKEFSQWPTIPQLYVKGEFVGGCDIVREMFETGELEQLMKEKGVTLANAAPEGQARPSRRRTTPSTGSARRKRPMERASVRALACRTEGDMDGQEMLVRRMGLARIGRLGAVVGQRRLVTLLQRLRQPVVERLGPRLGLGVVARTAHQGAQIVRGAA